MCFHVRFSCCEGIDVYCVVCVVLCCVVCGDGVYVVYVCVVVVRCVW